MDDLDLGARISYWRERRGLTQQLLADRVGRSKSWLEKVEAGTRNADRLPVLLSICRELRIDLPVLIGRDLDRDTPECMDDDQVEAIRRALERYDGIRADLPADYRADIPRLRRQLAHVWNAFEMADYGVLSASLPGLIVDAQRANAADGSEDARRILAEAYRVTGGTLRKLGEYSLGWLAADRGVALAEQVGDVVLTAFVGTQVANNLISLGRPGPALDLSVSYAARLESARGDADLSVYGHAFLSAAMAAAAAGDARAVRDLVAEARDAASRVPDHANHFRLSFGMTNVGIHHVCALVSLGEGGLAAEAAARIDEAGLRAIRRERRASHYVDVARGHSQAGQRDEALQSLLQAEAAASREVVCRPVARATIENLIQRSRGKPPSALSALAARAGVAA